MEQQVKDPRIIRNTEIANDVVAHVNKGGMDDTPIWDKHWSKDCVSVEGDGSEHAGREAMEKKFEWWFNSVTMHSCTCEGPYVNQDGFAIKYTIDCESKDGTWPRMTMSEVGVYTVEDGKVVRESFMGNPMDCPD
jgi:hypothetical protein